jgi:hypothetical protein
MSPTKPGRRAAPATADNLPIGQSEMITLPDGKQVRFGFLLLLRASLFDTHVSPSLPSRACTPLPRPRRPPRIPHPRDLASAVDARPVRA